MIPRRRLNELLSAFPRLHILVAGDLILDRYIIGDVARISPEAPVPVLRVLREEARPGGAGNVAANLSCLGVHAPLVGVLGDDAAGHTLRGLLKDSDRTLTSGDCATITKTRVLAHRQQIVRIDREKGHPPFPPGVTAKLLERIGKLRINGILVSDYAKGAVTPELMDGLRDLAARSRVPLVVDPKPLHASLYRGVTGITPNRPECEAILGEPIRNDGDAADAARRLLHRLDCRFVAVTRGDQGITAAERRRRTFHVPARGHEVFDVTGAGDTVAAVMTATLAAGGTLREAAILADAAASLVIEKVGTAAVTAAEIRHRLLQRGSPRSGR